MRTAFAALLFCLSAAAHAQMSVENVWVRSTVPAQTGTGGFMQLKAEKDARLVGVKSPVAGVAEIHEMKMEGDMMRMARIDALALPAGKLVELKPGSYHLMLMELKQPLAAGQKVPLELLFDVGGKPLSIKVNAAVRAP